MARKSKKKSILEEIRETIHFLTRPKRKRAAATTKRRKTTAARRTKRAPERTPEQQLQDHLEQRIARKMTDEMQKMKQQMQQELLETLTPKTAVHHDHDEAVKARKKTALASKGTKGGRENSEAAAKKVFKPQADCTLLKSLILSDRLKGDVIVGYEVVDNSSQEVWGIGVYDGIRLGRAKRILDTKVKSRTVDSERQYYLAHKLDEALYFSESYKKPALSKGKVATAQYTDGLAEAIRQAFKAGYTSGSKLPKL